MNIGAKIRALRKSRGLTQEQLATALGISYQAVSKWKTDIALPDITLLPSLAAYFGVSLDELFDFSLRAVEKEIEEIAESAYRFRESDPEKSKGILEDGLKKYPDNDILKNNLLYVLNYTKDPDTTIALAASLVQSTARSDIRYDAYRFLAYAYKAKGDLTAAAAAIEQIPEFYFTKLTEMAFLLEGKPKYEAAEKQKHISFENLLQMMQKLSEYYESEGELKKAANECEKALKLIEIIDHSAYDVYVGFFRKRLEKLL